VGAFAVQAAAGCAAEVLIFGEHHHGDGSDAETIAACVTTARHHAKLGQGQKTLDAHQIMETARALCHEYRDKITAVADALQERGVLSGDLEDLACPGAHN
jgi:hypothetical protein